MYSDLGAAVLDDYVYVCGGDDGTKHLNSVERYNPNTMKWSNVTAMNKRRSQVELVTLEGYIYAIGGVDTHVVHNSVITNVNTARTYTFMEYCY